MSTYTILGLGMMGEAICYDLLNFNSDILIHLIDIDQSRIESLKERFSDKIKHLKFHKLSITDNETEIKSILENSDLAFGAIDYRFNLLLTEWCISTSTHFLDLGGNPDVVASQFELNDRAQSKNITIIPDCGLAPGMANVLASGIIKSFDEVKECHIRVGGLPEVPVGQLKYQQVFSIRGLTNEYIEDAIVIRNGQKLKVPSLTELEDLYFKEPYGRMEAFQTAGGTSSLPDIYEGKIDELTYKTIRYPGHMQYFKFLNDFGLLSEETVCDVTIREIVENKLVEHLPRDDPDVVLIRIFVIGQLNNDLISTTWETIDHADMKNEISAMGRTTAYPISIIGQMIVKGIIQDRGVIPGEIHVPFENFVNELSKRDIQFQILRNQLV